MISLICRHFRWLMLPIAAGLSYAITQINFDSNMIAIMLMAFASLITLAVPWAIALGVSWFQFTAQHRPLLDDVWIEREVFRDRLSGHWSVGVASIHKHGVDAWVVLVTDDGAIYPQHRIMSKSLPCFIGGKRHIIDLRHFTHPINLPSIWRSHVLRILNHATSIPLEGKFLD